MSPRAMLTLDLPGGATLTLSWPAGDAAPAIRPPVTPAPAPADVPAAVAAADPAPFNADWWRGRVGQLMLDRNRDMWRIDCVTTHPDDGPRLHVFHLASNRREAWACDSPAARSLQPAAEYDE